ncbi:unnamed protein product [Caenorhabditis sp. 36 PRJEB53466]|nr:unnamed protein product [Caenorhabditis sp. 36 PRJEB53466]
MKQKSFELLCAFMLGFGQLCVMVGFDAESFILESVIHSIHEREPGIISPYAGYYGQAVIYAAYMTTCLFAPSILNISTSKTVLVIAAVCFTGFPLGFLFTNSYYYFFSAALLGVGTAFFYLGQGSYLTSHSTRQTIESNVSLSWSVGCCCMIIGSAILAGITSLSATSSQPTFPAQNSTSDHQQERRFSDMEIKLIFGAFSAISAVAIVTFALLPAKDVDSCIESSEKRGTFWTAFKLTCSTVVSPKMLQLLPLTVLGGFNVSFWLAIFPTAMNFTKHNSHMIYIPAVYSLGAGLGEVIMGIVISSLSKRIKGFGLKPTMLIGAFSTISYCALVHVSTPFEAPMRPTSQQPMLVYQSYPLIFVIAFICGISDCCINGVRSVICALVQPARRAQSFSVARMYHAAACVICFFFSPFTPLYVYTIGLSILSAVATIIFFRVADNTKVMERKLTQISMEKKRIEELEREFH